MKDVYFYHLSLLLSLSTFKLKHRRPLTHQFIQFGLPFWYDSVYWSMLTTLSTLGMCNKTNKDLFIVCQHGYEEYDHLIIPRK